MSGRDSANATSSYYPPRARWHSRLFYLGSALRNRLRLNAAVGSAGMSLGSLLLCLAVPGYVFSTVGRKRLAWITALAYVLTGLCCLVWLGYPVANLSAGLLLSIHSLCLFHLVGRWRWDLTFRGRVLLCLLLSAGLGFLVYLPVRNLISAHLVMPLRVKDRVTIVTALVSPHSVRRGDVLAYRIDPVDAPRAWVAEGYGCGVVQAVAGDRVVFGPATFSVNGIVQARRPLMPVSGEWVVPEKHWFIWPDSSMNLDRQFAEAYVAAVKHVVWSIALVPESHFVGKPLKRWFWRRQVLP